MEEKLAILPQAVQCYQKVVDEGFHRPSIERLIRLYEKLGDYEQLVCVLQKDILKTPKTSELISYKLAKLGSLYWKKLNEAEKACRVYYVLLQIQSDHVEGLNTLEEIFEYKKKWYSLSLVVQRKLQILCKEKAFSGEITEENELKIFELYKKLAQIYEKYLHQGSKAIFHYEKSLEIYPKDISILQKLQDLYKDWGEYQKLVDMYQQEMDLIEDEERIAILYKKLAQIWIHYLFDPHHAIQNYQNLLAIHEDIESLKALANLYKSCERFDEWAEISHRLLEHAEQEKQEKEQIQLHLQLGKVYLEKLNREEDSISSFQKILEFQPLHTEAFKYLEEIYEKGQSTFELVELLEQRQTYLKDKEEIQQVEFRLGKLYYQSLKNYEKSILYLEEVISYWDDKLEAFTYLREIYHLQEDWKNFVRIAERELALTNIPEEKAKLCFLLGNTYETHFQKRERGYKYFLEAIDHLPSHVSSLSRLADIALENEEWEEAAQYMTAASGYCEDIEEKIRLHVALGNLYLHKIQHTNTAKGMFEAALALRSECIEALEPLVEIYFEQEKWVKLELLLARLVALISKKDVEKLALNYYRWGKVAQALEDEDNAIGHYLNVLEAKPDHIEATFCLGDIYWKRSNWAETLKIYNMVYQNEKVQDKRDILHRLAVAQENLQHYSKAIECYEELVEYPGTDKATIFRSLADLQIQSGCPKKSLPYLNNLIEGNFSKEEKLRAFKKKAHILTEEGENSKAIECYLKASKIDPENEKIARELVQLFLSEKNWKKAEQWNQKHYELLENNPDKAENRCLQAHILWQGLQKESAAVKAYEEALEIHPICIEAMKGIEEIYTKKDKPKDLAEIYERFLRKIPQDKKEKGKPFHISLARLYHKLDNTEEAIIQYEKALSFDPNHQEIRIALAELKTQNPKMKAEAIEEHLRVLRKDPLRTASYRVLYKLLLDADKKDLALRCMRAMDLLEKDHSLENIFGDKIAPHPPQIISREKIATYLVPSSIHPLAEIMVLTGEYQKKNYPAQIEKKYSISKKQHLAMSSKPHPLWERATKLMQMLQIEIKLYLLEFYHSPQFFVENTNPASILVSRSLYDKLTQEEQNFLLAKAMFFVSQKQILAQKLSKDELQNYFAGLQMAFQNKAFISSEMDPKKLQKPIPRSIRKILQEKQDLWKALTKQSFDQYAKQIQFASNRFAFYLSDSLELAITTLHKLKELQKGHGRKIDPYTEKDLKQNQEIQDLLLFHISKKYEKLR